MLFASEGGAHVRSSCCCGPFGFVRCIGPTPAGKIAGTLTQSTAPFAYPLLMLPGERRDIVPIGNELRALAWSGVMLMATGVGIVVKKHFDQIGPLTIAAVIAIAAIACYAWAAWRQSQLRDYVVLLGALLISADVAFIETQWHILGDEWQRHFLLLAALHAAAAYWFDTRAVLSLSIGALAAWLGIEQNSAHSEVELAIRLFICAAILVIWRLLNRNPDFTSMFEHFAANIAFWGALTLAFNDATRWLGVTLALAGAAASVVYGFRLRREPFVAYGNVYGFAAVDIAVASLIKEPVLVSFFVLFSMAILITIMLITHLRFRRLEA